MARLTKLCDAADWFDPALARIIREELRELPRFHRKQWEFAMILRALREHGLLQGDRVGLSMGGGRERLLYAVAQRVRRLVVTDLYDPATLWEGARTNDPDGFIKADKPFPVDDARLKALRMDMRSLDFEDECFDFCYSSCAIEHIGVREDFLRHLAEAYRVLRDGGVYVLTTEFHYGPEAIEHPQNYVFSPGCLRDLLAATHFTPEPELDARIAPHKANLPIPANLDRFCFAGDGQLSDSLLREFTHVQLLRGRHPHTSATLVLRKDKRATRRRRLRFRGLEQSREFMAAGVDEFRSLLERSRLSLDPYAFLPQGAPSLRGDGAAFHTDYVWLGSGRRTFRVCWNVVELATPECRLELRVHGQRTLGPPEVLCLATEDVVIQGPGQTTHELSVAVEDDASYAVLAKVVGGDCLLDRIRVESAPAPGGAPLPGAGAAQ